MNPLEVREKTLFLAFRIANYFSLIPSFPLTFMRYMSYVSITYQMK